MLISAMIAYQWCHNPRALCSYQWCPKGQPCAQRNPENACCSGFTWHSMAPAHTTVFLYQKPSSKNRIIRSAILLLAWLTRHIIISIHQHAPYNPCFVTSLAKFAVPGAGSGSSEALLVRAAARPVRTSETCNSRVNCVPEHIFLPSRDPRTGWQCHSAGACGAS